MEYSVVSNDGCAGSSGPSLSVYARRHIFTWCGPQIPLVRVEVFYFYLCYVYVSNCNYAVVSLLFFFFFFPMFCMDNVSVLYQILFVVIILAKVRKKFDAQRTKSALIQFADNAGPDQPAQMRTLIRASVARLQNPKIL